MTVDAIVLAGGRSSRLGGVDKSTLLLDDRSLLERTLGALDLAERIVIVGEVPAALLSQRVMAVREQPAFSGPAAAVVAGQASLASQHVPAELVAVVACDMPDIARALPLLLAAILGAPPSIEGVAARDGGQRQYLAGIHRARSLSAAIERVGDARDLSMRALLAPLNLLDVEVPTGSTLDVDTWEDGARWGVTRPVVRPSMGRTTP